MRALWQSISNPRHLSLIYFSAYGIALLTGLVTLAVPPTSIAGELGPVYTIAWSVFFILGGILGLATALQGWWKWERWACWFTLAGIGIYGGVVLTLHFTSVGSRLTQLGVLLLAATLFAVRVTMIWGRSYGPRAV